MQINDIAAIIHADMCNDERNGYSQYPRWGGDYGQDKTLIIDGKPYTYALGSWDCSSSCVKAWQLAIQYTAYAGRLDGASYTGNILSVFRNSGLFDVWNTYLTEAERGDLYLNEECHVAMCQYGGQGGTWDSLSEFSINEFGDIHGGQVGDQTGWESHITGFYNYPWDCTLHYNHKADGTESDIPAPSAPSGSGQADQWQGDVVGKDDTTGAGDDYAGVYGEPILYIAIEGVGEYQAHVKGQPDSNWLPKVSKYDLGDEEHGMAGDGRPIDGIWIFDPTVKYQTHNLGGDWNEVMIGTEDSSKHGDDYAGDYGVAQDAIRIWREDGKQPRYNVFS